MSDTMDNRYDEHDAALANGQTPDMEHSAGSTQVVSGKKVPTIFPTMIVTLLFGIFGLIPALMAEREARDAGAKAGVYLLTFLACLLVQLVIGLIYVSNFAPDLI